MKALAPTTNRSMIGIAHFVCRANRPSITKTASRLRANQGCWGNQRRAQKNSPNAIMRKRVQATRETISPIGSIIAVYRLLTPMTRRTRGLCELTSGESPARRACSLPLGDLCVLVVDAGGSDARDDPGSAGILPASAGAGRMAALPGKPSANLRLRVVVAPRV